MIFFEFIDFAHMINYTVENKVYAPFILYELVMQSIMSIKCLGMGRTMGNSEDLIVNGFRFGSLADAETAREEEKKIKYIAERMNYEDPVSVLVIYNKMIMNRVFVTPVGNIFLDGVQKFLLHSDKIDPEEIVPIPLYTLYTSTMNGADVQPKTRITPRKVENFRKQYTISKAVIVILLLMVAGMFVISNTASNPNILNYKAVLENQYASWEQSLTEREKRIREKEREYGEYLETTVEQTEDE